MKPFRLYLLLFLLIPFSVLAQIDFKPALFLDGANDGEQMATGDFDGNGLQDAVVTIWSTSEVIVIYSQAPSGFIQKKFTFSSNFSGRLKIAVSDVNKDGKDDIIAVNEVPVTGAELLVCLSTGTDFDTTPVITQLEALQWRIEIADLDNDSNQDIVLEGVVKWVYLKGSGNGQFTPGSTEGWPIVFNGVDFRLIDINSDNKLDFVFITGGLIVVATANGSGYDRREFPYSGHPTSSMLADFSGDNKPDIVIVDDFTSTSKLKYFVNDGTSGFLPPVTIASPLTQLHGLDHTDFDNDGKEDILAGSFWTGKSTLLLRNLGNGNFQNKSPAETQHGAYLDIAFIDLDGIEPLEIAAMSARQTITYLQSDGSDYQVVDELPFGVDSSVGVVYDLDNDGYNDLVGASANGTIPVWYGKADMTFEAPVFIRSFGSVKTVVVADFNDDNLGDIAFSAFDFNVSVTTSSVFMATGVRTFAAAKEISSSGTFAMLAADVNNDSKIDLVTDQQVFKNDGLGDFTATTFNIAFLTSRIALGHFNNDNFIDLALVNMGKLYIGLNNGTGAFPSLTIAPDIDGLYALRTADANGDGFDDLIGTLNTETGHVIILLKNSGNGLFTQFRMLPTPKEALLLAADVGDINKDGLPDIITDQQVESLAGIGIYLAKMTGEYEYTTFFSFENGEDKTLLGEQFFLHDVNKDSRLDAVVFAINGPPATILEGNLIVEPTTSPTSLTVVPGSTTATVTLQKGDGNGRLICIRERVEISGNVSPGALPEDGKFYTVAKFGVGSKIGENYVVMSSDETSINVEGLSPSTRYIAYVYEYSVNERNTVINYRAPASPTPTLFTTIEAPVTGVDEWVNSFVVSPNPTSGIARIELPNNFVLMGEPVLYNSMGSEFRLPVVAGIHNIELNTADLRPGLYIIRLHGERPVSLKLLKQ